MRLDIEDIQNQYGCFGQIAEYQSHSGLVNTSSTLAVQYSYASGSDNTTRLTGITYPSGLYRVESLRHGQLSPEPTSGGQANDSPTVTGTTPTQQGSLDATGNWSGFINSEALNPGKSPDRTPSGSACFPENTPRELRWRDTVVSA